MRQIIVVIALALLLRAGESLNGIYLGDCPMVMPALPCLWAVQITEDGTVIARRDFMVPGMRDRFGNPVYIRRVVLK